MTDSSRKVKMRRTFLYREWIALFLVVYSCWPVFLMQANSEDRKIRASQETSGQKAAGSVRDDLSDTSRKFVSMIEGGEPSELLDFWSKSGVTFGVDGAVVSRRQLVKQLQQKLDLYCFFFETSCLRKQDEEQRHAAKAPPRKNALYSYRDLLRAAKSKEFKLSQRRDSGVVVGHVQVLLNLGDDISGDRIRVLEFIFADEKGGWKLTSVPYE